MFIENRPTDLPTHEAAIRIARRCQHVIQTLLREDEWADADLEFYRIARNEIENLTVPKDRATPADLPRQAMPDHEPERREP